MLIRGSRPRFTRHSSRATFCPSRASSQCFSQAPGASRSQHRLSSFLLTKYGSRGCYLEGCTKADLHRPTNTRSFFSAPAVTLSEVEQRFDCVQAQIHLQSEFDVSQKLLNKYYIMHYGKPTVTFCANSCLTGKSSYLMSRKVLQIDYSVVYQETNCSGAGPPHRDQGS